MTNFKVTLPGVWQVLSATTFNGISKRTGNPFTNNKIDLACMDDTGLKFVSFNFVPGDLFDSFKASGATKLSDVEVSVTERGSRYHLALLSFFIVED